MIDVCIGSANRDEARWENAEEFDIFRERLPHITFAAGEHTCMGLHLARMETRVALECLLDRLTDIRCSPTATRTFTASRSAPRPPCRSPSPPGDFGVIPRARPRGISAEITSWAGCPACDGPGLGYCCKPSIPHCRPMPLLL